MFVARNIFRVIAAFVFAFNTKGGKPAKWVETVEVMGRPFSFSLKGLEGDGISASIGELFSVDAQGTESAVLSLKHEQILGRALRVLAEKVLASAAPKKPA